MSRLISVNIFSLHGMYRDRIVRSFLNMAMPQGSQLRDARSVSGSCSSSEGGVPGQCGATSAPASAGPDAPGVRKIATMASASGSEDSASGSMVLASCALFSRNG